jgi:hypothetical protein
MAFRRLKERNETPAEFVRLSRRMANDDPLVFRVASQAVNDWLERFPRIARAAGESDDPATRSARMLSEAYMAAAAAQSAVRVGDGDPTLMFNVQFGIAREQTALGVSTEWVVALMQIRCFASGYMLGALGHRDACDELGRLFNAFVEQVERTT